MINTSHKRDVFGIYFSEKLHISAVCALYIVCYVTYLMRSRLKGIRIRLLNSVIDP